MLKRDIYEMYQIKRQETTVGKIYILCERFPCKPAAYPGGLGISDKLKFFYFKNSGIFWHENKAYFRVYLPIILQRCI